MNTFLFVSLSCRVSASGVVLELMNGWTEINFCLPIKAHNLPFDSELCIMVSWIALDQTGFGQLLPVFSVECLFPDEIFNYFVRGALYSLFWSTRYCVYIDIIFQVEINGFISQFFILGG